MKNQSLKMERKRRDLVEGSKVLENPNYCILHRGIEEFMQ